MHIYVYIHLSLYNMCVYIYIYTYEKTSRRAAMTSPGRPGPTMRDVQNSPRALVQKPYARGVPRPTYEAAPIVRAFEAISRAPS